MFDEIKVLMIEDNLGDARLINEMIKEVSGVTVKLEHSLRLSTALEKIKQEKIDVVLLDLGLPDSNGLNSVTRIMEVSKTLPIVVLTGFEDDDIGMKAVKMGAQDYLIKLQIDSNLLVRCLRYAIQRKKMELSLQQNNRIISAISDFIVFLDRNGTVLNLDGDHKIYFGNADVQSKNIEEIFPKEVTEKVLQSVGEVLETKNMIVFETNSEGKDCYEFRMTTLESDIIILFIKKLNKVSSCQN